MLAGANRVHAGGPTSLLFVSPAVCLPGSKRGLPWTAGSLSICHPKSGKSHWAQHLPSDLIKEGRKLHFFFH